MCSICQFLWGPTTADVKLPAWYKGVWSWGEVHTFSSSSGVSGSKTAMEGAHFPGRRSCILTGMSFGKNTFQEKGQRWELVYRVTCCEGGLVITGAIKSILCSCKQQTSPLIS